MLSVLLKDLMTVDMEDLRHTGSSIIGFTILDVKNYELAKTSGEMSQVITYLYYISIYRYLYISAKKKTDLSETFLGGKEFYCFMWANDMDIGQYLIKFIHSIQFFKKI